MSLRFYRNKPQKKPPHNLTLHQKMIKANSLRLRAIFKRLNLAEKNGSVQNVLKVFAAHGLAGGAWKQYRRIQIMPPTHAEDAEALRSMGRADVLRLLWNVPSPRRSA